MENDCLPSSLPVKFIVMKTLERRMLYKLHGNATEHTCYLVD